MAGQNQRVMLLASLVIAAFVSGCSAVTHTVGGNTGWTIPSSASFYSNWAAGQTFTVGDVLVFNFPAGAHTVAQVNQRNFNACSAANPIGPVQNTSPANVTLSTAGIHYFICTVPGHCNSNQSLSVLVTGPSAAAPAPSSSGATAPAAGPTGPTGGAISPSGSSTNPSTTSAPPPSFATSTSVGLLSVVSVAVAAALMF